jgi:beta-fructofuranosidase
MIGWMSRLSDAQENILKKHAAHIHCLTMPRVLTLKNQHLYQQPLKEMYQLLGKQKSLQDQISRTFYLKLTQSEHFHLNINQEMKIHYDHGRFTLERYDWSQDNYETKEVKIDRFTNMEIWSDTSSFEVFLNDGAYVFSLRTLPRSETIQILFSGDGQPHIQELEVHK